MRKLWPIALILMLLGCQRINDQVHSATPVAVLSQAEFQRRVADQVIRKEPGWKILEETPLKLQAPGEFSITLPLQRAYKIYEKSPEQLEKLVEEEAQGCITSFKRAETNDQSLSDYRKASPYLLPGVVPAGRYGDSREVFIRPFSKHVSVIYYYDHPDSPNRVVLQPEQLVRWKITPEALHKKAIENLAKLAKATVHEQRLADLNSVCYSLEPADDYGASRILLTPSLDALAARAKDDVYFWVPARDLLWGVGAHEAPTVKIMQQVSSNLTNEAAEPISSVRFVYHRKTGRVEEMP